MAFVYRIAIATPAHSTALAAAAVIGLASSIASAAGISARFGNDAAVVGRDVIVRIEVTDPVGVVDRIEVDLRAVGTSTWTTAPAVPAANERTDAVRWWAARFPSGDVWRPPRPTALEARARIYGRRGGVLLALGDLEPYAVDVLTPAEARRRAEVLSAGRPGAEASALPFAGYLGVDGRAGTGARARLFLGFGGPVARRAELVAFVTIGPAFARPDRTAGGGPITLGAELAARFYTRPLAAGPWTLFAAPYGALDARFAGLDVGGGLRAGVTWIVRSELAVELALGGALMQFGVAEAGGDHPGLGFMGGARLGLRLGAIADD